MQKIDSAEKLRQALDGCDKHRALISAEDFLRQSARQNDKEVQQILYEIADSEHEANGDLGAYLAAVAWLTEYLDPRLVTLHLRLLNSKRHLAQAILTLGVLADRGVVPADNLTVVEPLIAFLSHEDVEVVSYTIRALQSCRALRILDRIVPFLENPHWVLRQAALFLVIPFSKETRREELLDKVVPLLHDPERQIRLVTATCLKNTYPEQFSTLDLNEFWAQE